MKITAEFSSADEVISLLTQLQTFFRQNVLDEKQIEHLAKTLGTSSDALAAALKTSPRPPTTPGAS